MITLLNQIYAFGITMVAGAVAGVLFDLYRVIRFRVRPGKIVTHLGDLLYWVVLTIIVFVLLLAGNGGEVRIYVFIGLGLGYFFYQRLCSRFFLFLFRRLFRFIGRIGGLVWKVFLILGWLLLFPFRLLGKMLVWPFHLCGLLLRPLGRIGRRIWQRLFSAPPPGD